MSTCLKCNIRMSAPTLRLAPCEAIVEGQDSSEECSAYLAAAPVSHREAMLPDRTEHLTVRELTVLELLARGFSQKEIATTLFFSWQTVAKYTNNIYQKLRVTG